MKRKHLKISRQKIFKIGGVFVLVSIFLAATAYALSTQLFTVSGNTTILSFGECPTDVNFIFEKVNSWTNQAGYTHFVRLNVANNSSTRIDDWTITMKGPSDLGVGSASAEYTVDNGEIVATPTGNYVWAAAIEPGNTRNIDFQLTTAEPNLDLEYLLFNSCMVITGSNDSPLMNFTIDPTTVTLKINQSATPNIYKMPIDARGDFVFSSNDTNVATVNANGTITGVAPGSTVITATANGIAKSVLVTVTSDEVVMTAFSLASRSETMKVGDEKTLATVKQPADAGTPITWTSSNPNVVTVDSLGKVTAISGGSAIITAQAGGFSDSATITVIRDAVSEDLDFEFSNSYYYDNMIHFGINISNIGHSNISKISFKISFPAGTRWDYWSNYPAVFQADSTGTVVTSTGTTLSLSGGSYLTFTGMVTLPAGYRAADYLSPLIYDVEVE